MPSPMTCPDCGGELSVIGRERDVFRPDPETMTEGQMAEQMAAEMGGFYEEGVHGVITIRYSCDDCGAQWEERA